jgi:hypothetical protein
MIPERRTASRTEQAHPATIELAQVSRQLTEAGQRDAVHSLLQSSNPRVRELVVKAWGDLVTRLGKAATYRPNFEPTVLTTVLHTLARDVRHGARRAAIIGLATVVVDAVTPDSMSKPGLPVAVAAAPLEGLEMQTEFGLDLAYAALEDVTQFLESIDPAGGPVTPLPSYEQYRDGDIDAIFSSVMQQARQRIHTIAAGDQTYEEVLIVRAANKCITAEALQPPLSQVEQWLRAESLTSEQKRFHPRATTVADIEAIVQTGDEAALLLAIADFYTYPHYNAAIEYFWNVIEHNRVSANVQRAIAIKVASHQLVNGSNSARAFYQRLKSTPLAADPAVQRAFQLAFSEVSSEHNRFNYETRTPLALPHLRQAAALGPRVELVIHPFYALSSLKDFPTDGSPARPDFTSSAVAEDFIQQSIMKLFTGGLTGRLEDLLRAIDLLEEYTTLKERNPSVPYVVVVPKFEDSFNTISAEINRRRANQIAQVVNIFYGDGEEGNMYYVESQTEGSGYLFPADLEILIQRNPDTRYYVSGESPKRCVSNAITDLPATRLVPRAAGLSVDRREVENFLAMDVDFNATMQTMRQRVRAAWEVQPPSSFAEVSEFYTTHADMFDPYHQFTAQLFQPTVDRQGLILE